MESNLELLSKLKLEYIKNYILETNEKIEHVSLALNYKKTYVYEILSSKKKLSDEFFDDFLDKFNLTYYSDYKYYSMGKEFVNQLFYDYAISDDTHFFQIYHNYQIKKTILCNSSGFIFVDYIELMFNIKTNKNEANYRLLSRIENSFNLIGSYFPYIYLVLFQYNEDITRNYGKIVLKKRFIEKNYSLIDAPIEVKGMYYITSGLINEMSNLYLDAAKDFAVAKDIFVELLCVDRVLQIEIYMALIYLFSSNYNEAINRLLSIKHKAKDRSMMTRVKECNVDLCFIYIFNRDYIMAQELCDELENDEDVMDAFACFKSFITYKLKKIDECKDIIYYFKHSNVNEYTLSFLKLVEGMINHKHDKIKTIYLNLKQILTEHHELMKLKLILHILIDYFTNRDLELLSYFISEYFMFRTLK